MAFPSQLLKSAVALDRIRGQRPPHRATRGERVMGSLFPNRGIAFPGGWSQDRVEQVNHFRNWTYVAVNCICSKIASIIPNMAYVVDSPRPGVTTKACQRGLMNVSGRGFGGSPYSGGVVKAMSSVHSPKSTRHQSSYMGTDFPSNQVGVSDGGHSFLTIGELRSKSLSVVKPHENLEPLENDHPLRRLIENPNPFDTTFDLFYELQMFDELCGVDYLWAVPNDWGMPCELWCVPSHWVWPRTGGRIPNGGAGSNYNNYLTDRQYDPDQEVGDHLRYGSRYVDLASDPNAERMVQYYEVRPWGGMGSAGILRIPPNEMIVNKWKSPLNKIDGYSRLSAVAQWIDSEESISKSRWSQFSNIARPEFWVELGPGYEDPDDEKIERIEAKFMAKVQGEYNYGKPVITPPGTKISPLSFSPTEMCYFQCVDAITECLTKSGWKKCWELNSSDEVAIYDTVDDAIKYEIPSSIHVNYYDGNMFSWETDSVSALMTHNHRAYILPEEKDGDTYFHTKQVRDCWVDHDRFSVLTIEKLECSAIPCEFVIKPIDRNCTSVVRYSGLVWCVTVSTGLFLIRRNDKVHVTGNSEDQIRDMILSAFQVPKSSVGILNEMTYGSLLASLANFCQMCLNPRLSMRGQVLSKHLSCRWDEPGRKVKLWFDDTVPADPQQVNADMTVDGQFFALTPNEVRAIRGRSAYRAGGDDPMAPGPGGIMPIPMNTGEDASPLGTLISHYVTSTQPEPPPPPPGMLPGPPGAEAEGAGDPNATQGPAPVEAPPGIGTPEMEGPPRGRGPGSEGPLELSAHDMLADLGGIKTPNRRAQDHLLKSPRGVVRKATTPSSFGKGSIEGRLVSAFLDVKEVADTGPDYQYLFWNQSTRSVWYESADGDEWDDVQIIIAALKKVKGVSEVLCEAEASPPDDEGWVKIYPEMMEWTSKSLPSRKTPEKKGTRSGVGRGSQVTKKSASHSYSCVLAPVSDRRIRELILKMQDHIHDTDLYPEEGTDGGLERDPHVTVKYGLLTDDADDIMNVLHGEPPFEVVLGLTSVFPDSGKGYEVLKVDVYAEGLHRLNSLLEAHLDHERTHQEYNPHLTIAYLKPGTSARYVGDELLAGVVFEVNRLTFSPSTGPKSELRLK